MPALLLRLLPIILAAGIASSALPAVSPPPIESGEIAGAKFAIARPETWNRRVLLLAHGLRSEDRPLIADLPITQSAYQTLLSEGWIVATTSFRRNGIIIAQAIEDLDNLRDYISRRDGAPERVLLEGESMGGLIVTLMAERERMEPLLYSGAVAIDPALQLQEPSSRMGLTVQPEIPLLFLSNVSEIDQARSYVQAKFPAADPARRPVLFRLERSGHVNLNQAERLAALRALNRWLDEGRRSLPAPPPDTLFFDATVPAVPGPSRVIPETDGRGFTALVTEVSVAYGNVVLNAQPADFAAAGIGRQARFQLSVAGDTYRVLYGRDFTSVKRGEWVCFPNADGFILLARNAADAAASARLQPGVGVRIRRFPAPAPPP